MHLEGNPRPELDLAVDYFHTDGVESVRCEGIVGCGDTIAEQGVK
jgi:hypothetical protein